MFKSKTFSFIKKTFSTVSIISQCLKIGLLSMALLVWSPMGHGRTAQADAQHPGNGIIHPENNPRTGGGKAYSEQAHPQHPGNGIIHPENNPRTGGGKAYSENEGEEAEVIILVEEADGETASAL